MFGARKEIRALKYDNKVKDEQIEELQASLSAWKSAARSAKEELTEWRKKYELSQLSPEVKADTEAAFTRGAQFAKRNMLDNIRNMVTSLPEKEDA